MAETTATFDDERVQKFLRELKKNYSNVVSHHVNIWKGFSAIAFADVIKHFEDESGPNGKWTKWSDLYAAHMQRMGRGGNKILQFNGRLRQSVTMTSTSTRARQGILLYNPAKTKGGFPYAKAHNEGGNKLPQRQFFWMSDRALDLIAQHSLTYLLTSKGG